ncbi:MAG: DNA polymerase III subunit gamma/tau [Victivallaceae bacterium]|nr:DNA polymerase III subunit gamma/tau [Victivallaceae bacterium]
MSEYQVIARKWRPQRFADVVGQAHVLRTLKNAILNNRTAHAYLFVGPRGIGKTTTARIFAKALNCTNLKDGEPCGECPSCIAINNDASLDVIEIDAASHNSADYMRDLSEEVLHLPVSGRYKIYIIDEVHMLSKAAWNALLKTVEEPPSHVKFIFATTEANAVLPTIVSRCQRFDLQPIPTDMIFERLRLIAETEKIPVSDGALRAIARAASGGMRDAQSLLDQLTAFFSGGDAGIDEETVLSMFSLTAGTELEALCQALLSNDPAAVVTKVSDLAGRGRNLETLLNDVLATLRGAELVLLLGTNAENVLEADDETMERYRRLAASARLSTVRDMLEALSGSGRMLRDAVNKQIFLESILLKSMRQAHAVRLDDVLARLNQLRKAGELEFLDKIPSGKPAPEPVSAPAPAVIKPIIAEASVPDPAVKRTVEKTPAPAAELSAPEPPPAAPAAVAPETISDSAKSAPQTQPVPEGGDLWNRVLGAAAGEIADEWSARLESAAFREWRDNTLSVELLADPVNRVDSAGLSSVEATLTSALQSITGNWAAVVRLTAPQAPVFEPEEHLIEPEPEKAMPAYIDEERNQADAAPASDETGYYDAAGCDPDQDCEPEDEPPSKEETFSLMNDPDEYRKAQDEPAVRRIVDLFGGDVVDIRSL